MTRFRRLAKQRLAQTTSTLLTVTTIVAWGLLALPLFGSAVALAEPDSPSAPENAAAALDVAPGLEATLFASEPMMDSPSNIDVDHRGRVWVCEIVNYRPFRNKDLPLREQGDRILILQDTDGDAKADTSTVFYQGPEINSPHGVCVLGTPDDRGTRAIVSAGDSVFVFTDEDGDLKADKKDVLFTGISGVQHDHGIHAFVFGPDGKLYFNFGNEGKQIKDKHGKPIVDQAGNEVAAHRRPYQDGMVFRCNPDGSEFETLAWNFRNDWEVCVDSFGTLWQSDNDDDGNRGVRITYVMEFGNYGYKDELTGAGWQTPRTGMAEDIPTRHWHQHDPGVIPNLLQTGAGSPTGILVYEGRLLPKVFWDQLIHCDAGPNVVRAYPVTRDGAGYQAKIVNILEGTRDKWFRPSDVCVAPDGSLIVADWHDPGVGGHRAEAVLQGRLFRVAPPNTPYRVPAFDVSTPQAAVEALKSPNLATQHIAWTALHNMQQRAEPALQALYQSSENPRLRARALWLLGKIKGQQQHYVEMAIENTNPDIRITGLRLARQTLTPLPSPGEPGGSTPRFTGGESLVPMLKRLVHDPSAQVRRECAIALRTMDAKEANPVRAGAPATVAVPQLWAELASQYDGKDRWALEALGLAADGRWANCLKAWFHVVGDDYAQWSTQAGRDIIWRSRSRSTPDLLAQIISDSHTPGDELPRYFRAFDFQTGDAKQPLLTKLAFSDQAGDAERRNFIATEALRRVNRLDFDKHPEHRAAMNRVLDHLQGAPEFVELVGKFGIESRYPQLLALAQDKPGEQIGVEAVRVLLSRGQTAMLRHAVNPSSPADLPKGDGGEGREKLAVATIQALGNSLDGRIVGLLLPVVKDSRASVTVRREAVLASARTRQGAVRLIKLAEANQLDDALKPAAAQALHTANFNDVKQQAAKLFPLPAAKDKQPLPPVDQLLKMKGNADRGKLVFNTDGTCTKCHVVNEVGKEVGPNLSEIGDKLGRQALFSSILFPSSGISHNYETYTVVLDDGNVVNGLLISRTADAVTLKGEDALKRTFQTSQIALIRKDDVSLMPADLQKVMTAQDLVDVVDYLTTLKKATKP